jgi:hypothetical protein
MSVSAAQYTITSTPSKIYLGDGATTVHIHSASGTCYLGGSDVTTSTGFKIDNGDKLTIDTHEDAIWAVSATSNTIYTLVITK